MEKIKELKEGVDVLSEMLKLVSERLDGVKATMNEVQLDSLKSSPCPKCARLESNNEGGQDRIWKQLEKVSSKLQGFAKTGQKETNEDEEDEKLTNGCSSEASTVIEVVTNGKKKTDDEEFVDAEGGDSQPATIHETNQLKAAKPELSCIPVTPEYIKPAFKYLEVDLDRFVPFTITAVSSSRNFYGYRKQDSAAMEKFYQVLNDFYYGEDLDKYKVTSGFQKYHLYCYFYDSDQCYYRVMVSDFINNNQLKFIFVDIGSEGTGNLKDFHHLDPKFDDKRTPIFAVPCFVKDCWTKAFQIYDSALEKMLQDPDDIKVKEVKAKFSEPLPNGWYPVSLRVEMPDGNYCLHDYDFNCDMKEKYIENYFEIQSFLSENNILYDKDMIRSAYEKFNERYPFPSKSIEVFDPMCLKVIDISNFICTFNVIRTEDGFEVSNFTNNISLFYENLQALDGPIEVEQLVVFKIDKYYFRGYILSASVKDVYNVFAFDFGFVISLTKTVLYPMFDLFSPDLVPPFAILCSLDNIEPLKENWSTIAIKQFQNHVKDSNFLMTVNRVQKGKFFVDITAGNKDIVEILKRQKFAK